MWKQISKYFPLYCTIIGDLYAIWLNLRRTIRYTIGQSDRQWRYHK